LPSTFYIDQRERERVRERCTEIKDEDKILFRPNKEKQERRDTETPGPDII
jgi:hypothetical protein